MQKQQIRDPGAALTRFVALALFTVLFWWVAERGWPGAWFLVVLMGLAAFFAFFDVLRAHRAWSAADAITQNALKSSGRYDTREERRDGAPPDGWE